MGLNKWSLAQSYIYVKKRNPSVKLSDRILHNLLEFEKHIFGQNLSDKPQEVATPSQEVPSLVSTIITESYDQVFDKCQEMFTSRSSQDLKNLYATLPSNDSIGDILRRAVYLHVKEEAKSFSLKNYVNKFHFHLLKKVGRSRIREPSLKICCRLETVSQYFIS
jgi:hypothetical protein